MGLPHCLCDNFICLLIFIIFVAYSLYEINLILERSAFYCNNLACLLIFIIVVAYGLYEINLILERSAVLLLLHINIVVNKKIKKGEYKCSRIKYVTLRSFFKEVATLVQD